jgi:putative resolvase
MNTYNVSEFSKLVGVSVNTLQRWDREGRLVANRTVSNRRSYSDEHLAQALGISRTRVKRMTIVYARVSAPAQRADLSNQIAALERFCQSSGIAVDEWIDEIGSGLNFKRKKFLWVMDMLVTGRVERLIIAHPDRLARFGFSLIEHFCQVHQCDLIVLNSQSLSPKQEMVEDLMTIMDCFSSRLDGLGNYRQFLKQALKDDTGAQDTD